MGRMIDFREYKDIIRESVKAESRKDLNWKWTVKAINKHEIKIGWGYLDYVGEADFFRIIVNDAEDGDEFVTARDPFSGNIASFMVGSEFYQDGRAEDIIPKAVRAIAYHAHYTW